MDRDTDKALRRMLGIETDDSKALSDELLKTVDQLTQYQVRIVGRRGFMWETLGIIVLMFNLMGKETTKTVPTRAERQQALIEKERAIERTRKAREAKAAQHEATVQ